MGIARSYASIGRSYLRFTRAHTAPLETIPAIVGASLAVGTVWNPMVWIWGLYGLLYHLTGYSMNSLVDWSKGFDEDDPNKQHHPLNRESITKHGAGQFVIVMVALTTAVAVLLVIRHPYAVAVLVLGAASGIAYNLFGKYTEYKFVLISIAHTTVFVLPFIALGGDVFSYPFRLGVLYVFLWVAFQISVSGEIKDIHQMKESNFLRDTLGVYINVRMYKPPDKDIVVFTSEARYYSVLLKDLNLIVGGFIFLWIENSMTQVTPASVAWLSFWGVLMIVTSVYSMLLVMDGEYRRPDRIRRMAIIELLTLSIFVATYLPVIGLSAVVTLITLSVVWVLAFNQIEWGTWVAPEV